jgi:hypothetical protein
VISDFDRPRSSLSTAVNWKISKMTSYPHPPLTRQCWPKANTGDGGKPEEDRVSGYSPKYLLAKKRKNTKLLENILQEHFCHE